MRTFIASLWVFCLIPAVYSAPVPKPIEKDTAEKVIGKWKLIKGEGNPGDGVTFIIEFTKDGKLTVTYEYTDQKITQTLKGTYKTEKDKIHYTMETGNGERKETLTVEKLDDEDLIVVDPEKKKEEFKRIKVK